MDFFYILLIALANNLDNIGVRIAYSIKGIRITNLKNLWISVITFLISSIAAFSGSIVSKLFSRKVSSFISMALLIAIGIWIIAEPYIKRKAGRSPEQGMPRGNNIYDILREPENADMDNSKDIDFKEATFLGIALSINNIGGGLSAGMIGLNSIFVGFFSAAISFVALWMGNMISRLISRLNLGNKAVIAAGVLMILLGIRQII